MDALPPQDLHAVAAVVSPAKEPEPPSIFERSREEMSGRRTFLLPGVSYLGWHPIGGDRAETSGGGLEISLVRWIATDFYLGLVTQGEKLDRFRAGFGFEGGYQYVGLETSVVRELADRDGHGGQWSLQIAPYASLGMAYVAARWVVALDRKADSPGSGAMLVIGLKIPIVLGKKQ